VRITDSGLVFSDTRLGQVRYFGLRLERGAHYTLVLAHDHCTILDKAGGRPCRNFSLSGFGRYHCTVCWFAPCRDSYCTSVLAHDRYVILDKAGGRPHRTFSLSFTRSRLLRGMLVRLIDLSSLVFFPPWEVCIKWGLRVREYAVECCSGP